MTSNVLSLNETTKKYQVTFDSGDEDAFKVHIRDMIVEFPANDDRIYISKPDKKFLGQWLKILKRKMTEVLNNLQTVGENKKGFREFQYKK